MLISYVLYATKCLNISQNLRNGPAPNVYQRLGPMLILKLRLRHSAHPFATFYRGGGENVQKVTK